MLEMILFSILALVCRRSNGFDIQKSLGGGYTTTLITVWKCDGTRLKFFTMHL